MAEQTLIRIRVSEADFDVQDEQQNLLELTAEAGAVVSFTGFVREFSSGASLDCMLLEHYPGMTESALEKIAQEAAQRWSLKAVNIIHRIGRLDPKARIVLVQVVSRHRGDAFAACEFVMDYLKTRAPFWKKEFPLEGQPYWVEAKETDEAALARWF